jgi:lipoate-protein ligase A
MHAIHLIECSWPEPESNLAYDEALLNVAEEQAGPDVLRLWESPTPFVVLGVSQPVGPHVNQEACAHDGVPILRRCSAGGCVVQGPGSLNYALVLNYGRHHETQTLHGSYCFILNRIAAAFQARGFAVRHRGISDLSLDDRKISGNAQRRRKHCFLHHGTLLYGPPNDWMERYLHEPADRPHYRGDRTHADFVARLPLSGDVLLRTILDAFEVSASRIPPTTERAVLAEMEHLLESKYRRHEWHFRR